MRINVLSMSQAARTNADRVVIAAIARIEAYVLVIRLTSSIIRI